MLRRHGTSVRAGLAVDGIGIGTRGTLGLMVHDADRRVGVLTVATVLPPGIGGFVEGRFPAKALTPSGHFAPADPWESDAISDASALLVSAHVSEDVMVSAAVAGVVEAGCPVAPGEILGLPLLVSTTAGLREVGAIRAYGCTAAIRWPNGVRRVYSNLVEVALLPDFHPERGDAGALVATQTSDPLGLIVGAVPGAILVAPLAEAMAQARLESLSTFGAQEHCGRMMDRASQATQEQRQRLAARDEDKRAPVIASSEEMLAQSTIGELILELEGAE